MQITTKYNIEDKVYLLSSNKIINLSIEEFLLKGYLIKLDEKLTCVYRNTYRLTGFSTFHNENELFPTKQELIDSL